MKTGTQKRWAMLALVMTLVAVACKKDTPSAASTATAMLTSGTWKISSVTVDNTDKTASFAGMTLAFTATTHSAANGNKLWAASGTWAFTDPTSTAFKRDDGVVVTIKSISSSQLQLAMSWGGTLARSSSVTGQYVFSFVK